MVVIPSSKESFIIVGGKLFPRWLGVCLFGKILVLLTSRYQKIFFLEFENLEALIARLYHKLGSMNKWLPSNTLVSWHTLGCEVLTDEKFICVFILCIYIYITSLFIFVDTYFCTVCTGIDVYLLYSYLRVGALFFLNYIVDVM